MFTRSRHRSLLPALAAGLITLAAGSSGAQADKLEDEAAARALFDQAVAEMAAKQYTAACPRLEEVTRLIPEGIGAHDKLGECYEAVGKLASAWSQYDNVVALAAKAGQFDRSKEAAAKAGALKGQVATLTLQVPSNVRSIRGISIARDGAPMPESQWGQAVPVDPGAHEVEITAPGHERSKKQVEVPTNGVKVIYEVSAPALLRAAPTAAPSPVQRILGIAVIGVGAAGVGVGAVLGGLAIGKKDESNQQGHCDAQDRCDDVGFALRSDARSLGTGSTAALIAGGVLLAGGVVLFFTAPAAAEQKRPTARIEVAPGGLLVRGSF
jgi:hypothetical protein